MKKYLKTTEKVAVENYPYGRLKTTMYFWVEFKPSHGFRVVTQSINPKTNKLNKPHAGTYYPLVVLTDTDGHISFETKDFNGQELLQKNIPWVGENFDLFTPEQIKSLYAQINMFLLITMKATATYKGADINTLKPLFMPALTATKKGYNEGGNVFNEVVIDWGAVKAAEIPDYNPFKTTETFSLFSK